MYLYTTFANSKLQQRQRCSESAAVPQGPATASRDNVPPLWTKSTGLERWPNQVLTRTHTSAAPVFPILAHTSDRRAILCQGLSSHARSPSRIHGRCTCMPSAIQSAHARPPGCTHHVHIQSSSLDSPSVDRIEGRSLGITLTQRGLPSVSAEDCIESRAHGLSRESYTEVETA
jgi:hypothetical protein